MPIDRRLEKDWNKELEEGLPDCRLHNRERNRVLRGRMWFDMVYCANCGHEGGLVTSDWTPHVFFICNECAEKCGPPPGVTQVSAEDEAHMRGS
jgi:hypothetical protein